MPILPSVGDHVDKSHFASEGKSRKLLHCRLDSSAASVSVMPARSLACAAGLPGSLPCPCRTTKGRLLVCGQVEDERHGPGESDEGKSANPAPGIPDPMQVSSHLPVSGAVSAPPIIPAEQGDRIDLPDTEALTLNRHVIAKASKKFPLPFYPAARPDSRPTVAPLMLFGRDRKRVLQTLLGAACSKPCAAVSGNGKTRPRQHRVATSNADRNGQAAPNGLSHDVPVEDPAIPSVVALQEFRDGVAFLVPVGATAMGFATPSVKAARSPYGPARAKNLSPSRCRTTPPIAGPHCIAWCRARLSTRREAREQETYEKGGSSAGMALCRRRPGSTHCEPVRRRNMRPCEVVTPCHPRQTCQSDAC